MSSNPYPTAKQIKDILPEFEHAFPDAVINLVTTWKNTTWKNTKNVHALQKIATNLLRQYNANNVQVTIKQHDYIFHSLETPKHGKLTHEIIINKNNPSILSTFHEIAHTLQRCYHQELSEYSQQVKPYDLIIVNTSICENNIIDKIYEKPQPANGYHNELWACAWSIALFKQTFPKAYKLLQWDKHMLVKNTDYARNKPSLTKNKNPKQSV